MKCGLLNPYDVGWVLPSTHHTADEDVLGECKCYNAIIGGNKSKHFQLSLILSQWLDGCGVECVFGSCVPLVALRMTLALFYGGRTWFAKKVIHS